MAESGGEQAKLQVTAMNFAYPGKPPFISNFSLAVSPGSRCLLIGANGAGGFGMQSLFKILPFFVGVARFPLDWEEYSRSFVNQLGERNSDGNS